MIVDKQTLQLQEDSVSSLLRFAKNRGYVRVCDVLMRGEVDCIHLLNPAEADEIATLAVAYRDDMELRFSYYDEAKPFFNSVHKEKHKYANDMIVSRINAELEKAYSSHFGLEAQK